MRHLTLTAAVLCALSLQAPTALAAGEGLRVDAQRDPWPLWQSRVAALNTTPANAGLSLGSYLPLGATRWSGDHFFSWGRLGESGGLRATGALLWATTPQQLDSKPFSSPLWRQAPHANVAWSTHEPDITAQPAAYVGLGYSAYWAKTGIGVSADLGLVSQRPGQLLQAGRGSESLWRSLQVSPMLQVNLSYAF
ncbi:hypothetical protein [Ideonella paludis]|uniref:Uncharacterized protein n=1 Tax=Ideonella paludis TaxID=1233411 RepID=A0ABS5DWD7_9BURK|nr:hypothetical protein [Ideonella paludis]MBQ0935457.1 hypothetical protein [Ideonella paludis]